MLVDRHTLLDEIDLVLQDDDVLQTHDLDGRQVLGGLRLRAALVAGYQQQRSIHDGGSVQHRGHEDVMALGQRNIIGGS